MVIKKKQFMGDKSLRSYVVPEGTKEIGEWAFASCRELARVAIPASVEKIGREAFANCDKLRAVSWYRESAGEVDELESLMAIALRFFGGDAGELAARRKDGSKAWLAVWDKACKDFLESSDEEGFRPFLAGGEEDYDDETTRREDFCRNIRRRKALAILTRLLNSGEGETTYFLERFRENDMALDVLLDEMPEPAKALEVYEKAGLLTRENRKWLLDRLPEGSVEMKALLLQKELPLDLTL